MTIETKSLNLITADALLNHWLGHRRLTRKMIEAFPEEKFFQFSIGGMRSFGLMAAELLGMEVPVVKGLATGEWASFNESKPDTKAELLQIWDAQTEELTTSFPQIPASSFTEMHKAFGKWEMPGINLVQYVIDNQIHHRGEGYVYLRALGIEPPAFWDRY